MEKIERGRERNSVKREINRVEINRVQREIE